MATLRDRYAYKKRDRVYFPEPAGKTKPGLNGSRSYRMRRAKGWPQWTNAETKNGVGTLRVARMCCCVSADDLFHLVFECELPLLYGDFFDFFSA